MGVEQQLIAILQKRRKNDQPFPLETRLDALDIDSLDIIEVIFEIEETFDVELRQTNDEARSATVADLCQWIERAQAAKSSPPAAAAKTRQA
jgi:acyl carrier protein